MFPTGTGPEEGYAIRGCLWYNLTDFWGGRGRSAICHWYKGFTVNPALLRSGTSPKAGAIRLWQPAPVALVDMGVGRTDDVVPSRSSRQG